MKRLALLVFLVSLLAVSAASSAQEPAPAIVRKSSDALEESAIKKVEPSYPALARAAQISGAVVVEVVIDVEGNVERARPLSGHPLLKPAAVAAAREWKFRPTLLSGVPIKVIGTLTFNFDLNRQTKDAESGKRDGGTGKSRADPFLAEVEWFREEVKQNPNSADAHYQLGVACRKVVHYEDAVRELKIAVKIKPDFFEAYYQLGVVYRLLESHEDALTALTKAVQLKPRNLEALIDIASVQAVLGRYDDSVANFKRALEIDPKSYDALMCLGITYGVMKKHADAAAKFKEALSIRPSDGHAHYQLGWTYVQMGDKTAAMEEYHILKKLDSPLADKLLREMQQ